MKKKKESSDSILNPKFKISEEAFKELSSGSDPLIYSSFDEAHDWFRELKRNLFRSVLKVNWRSIEYQCSKQSLTSALRIIEKDGNIRLIKLLSEDDKALLEFSYNKRPFKRQETIFKRMAELKDSNYLFAAATTEVNDISHSSETVSCLKPVSTFGILTPVGRAVYFYLGRIAFPGDDCFDRNLHKTISKSYGLADPDSKEFYIWKIMTEFDFSWMVQEHHWDKLEEILKPHNLHRIVPPYGDYHDLYDHEVPAPNSFPRRRFEGFISDLREKGNPPSAAKKAEKKLIKIYGQYSNMVIEEFNKQNQLLSERDFIIYGYVFQSIDKDYFVQVRKTIMAMISNKSYNLLRHLIETDLLFALAFCRVVYDPAKALPQYQVRRGTQMQWLRKEWIFPQYVLDSFDTIQKSGIRDYLGWTIKFLNQLVNFNIYEYSSAGRKRLHDDVKNIRK